MSEFTVKEIKRVREFIFSYATYVATLVIENVIVDMNGKERGNNLIGHGFCPGEIKKMIDLVGEDSDEVIFVKKLWTDELIQSYKEKVTPPADLMGESDVFLKGVNLIK